MPASAAVIQDMLYRLTKLVDEKRSALIDKANQAIKDIFGDDSLVLSATDVFNPWIEDFDKALKELKI